MRLNVVLSLFFLIAFGNSSCSYFPEEFDKNNFDKIYETSKYIRLGSVGKNALIFYPGGLVDPFSYVQFLSQLVNEEVNVFIAKVPYNLSILDIDHAKGIRNAFPEFETWTLMGHSLGGAVACFEVENNLDVYDNLILLAGYPSQGTDLTGYSGETFVFYGSQDFVLDHELLGASKEQFSQVEEVDDIDNLLISDGGTYFYEIEGGNHAQFGNYGAQNGDGEASISRETQQGIIISLLRSIL